MTKYVIGPDVALRLARDGAQVSAKHKLLAPTLLRSQVLSLAFGAVREGRIAEHDTRRQLDYVRKLNIRLLGDRTLQDLAWKIAAKQMWFDTMTAEYIALTELQADAFITLDKELARRAKGFVPLAPVTALFRSC